MSKFVSGIGRALSLLSFAFGKGARELPTIIISQDEEKLVLPVTPVKYEVGNEQENKTVDITQIGEVLLFGNPKLKTLSFEGFFPAKGHHKRWPY